MKNLLTEEISGSNKHLQQRKFTITLSTLSVIHQIPQETKHRDIISRSTSNNNSQAQEFNLPNILLTIRVENKRIESQWSYLQQSLAGKIYNFASGSGTFKKISLPINVTDSGQQISRTFIFRQKCHQAPPGIKLTA